LELLKLNGPVISETTNNRFIITGGPGSGKTSLIVSLQRCGYTVFPEIARTLINKGMTPPIRSHGADSGTFFDLILQSRINYHQQLKMGEIGFYDRGIPDSVAFMKFRNRNVPRVLSEAIAAYPYNRIVFFASPWKEIYITDQVRKESFAEATALARSVGEVYQSLGYRLVELPELSVDDRIEFILRELKIIGAW